ncbi:MAG: glycosyltransferase family 2 protein, partial [Burkholderiaceae bacterium]|nr:glycosyltransferase family 2 protein [Burkholderiaceae bacterium]
MTQEALPIVSVIVPVYNRAHCIARCLHSVLAQTLAAIEVIVVDDASSDATAEVVATIRDPRIRYWRHETNRGAAAARNTAMRLARGEFIAFIDSDDYWREDKLEKQVAALRARGARCGLSYCWIAVVDTREREVAQYVSEVEGKCLDAILSENFIGSSSNVVFRRAMIEEIGLLDESLLTCEDWDWYVRIATRSEFHCLREKAVCYTHDLSDAVRLTNRARVMRDGHRRMLNKHASAYRGMPRNSRRRAYLRYAEAFAEAG